MSINNNIIDLDNQGKPHNEEINQIFNSMNKQLFKLKSDLEAMKHMQNSENDINKTQLKGQKDDISGLKTELIKSQEAIGVQNAAIKQIEKEMNLFFNARLIPSSRTSQPDKSESIEEGLLLLMISTKNFRFHLKNAASREDRLKAFDSFKADIDEQFSECLQEVAELTERNKVLELGNSRLRDQYLDSEKSKFKRKFCIHCQTEFIPKFNEEVFSFT